MPSDAAKRKKAKKKALQAKKRGGKVRVLEKTPEVILSPWTVSGVLACHPKSRDIQVDRFGLTFRGRVLLDETRLELNFGQRYGLVGANGVGKSAMLKAISAGDVPLPDNIDVYLLENEYPPSEYTPLEVVLKEVKIERDRLENVVSKLMETEEEGMDSPIIHDVYERLERLDADNAERRAGVILRGLGFTKEYIDRKTKNLSGGWRMRVSLAKALFIQPSLLLLDDPTNHLDLQAVVWLEEHLKTYGRCLVIVSHSQDFLNNVATNIILYRNQKLQVYRGNYDSYVKTRGELERDQMKRFDREQDQIAHMKDYVARFGHGSRKLAKQGKSKEKLLNRMMADGLTEKVVEERRFTFRFFDCGGLPPPVLQLQEVTFGYGDGAPLLYKNLDFGLDMDSRVALVGANGAGKSTLLKLLAGKLQPLDGMARAHCNLRLITYTQHLSDMLDPNLSALQHMMRAFPEEHPEHLHQEAMRTYLGKFGLSGPAQLQPIATLSDGQRARVVFAWISRRKPHIILLDEPTNGLDIETIDSLAEAINEFEGGVCLVSHDFRLIDQVAKEILLAEDQTLRKWTKSIHAYKEFLKTGMVFE